MYSMFEEQQGEWKEDRGSRCHSDRTSDLSRFGLLWGQMKSWEQGKPGPPLPGEEHPCCCVKDW